MLERFRAAKRPEIERLLRLDTRGGMPARLDVSRPGFARALAARGPGAIIAEYKRASPSRGRINRSLDPGEAGLAFARAGAAAASVLTEERHFDGSVRFLEAMEGCGLPLLRKDFLLDPLQIRHTASTPASAVLLLARLFAREPDLLRSMVRTALAEGLEPVVEVFGPDDLELARFAGAGIIQVNNRDLETLRVDRGVSRELVRGKRTRELWISASGTRTGREIREMADLGFDACLVGTSIMACPDPEAHLRSLAGHETCSLCGRGPAREEGKC